MVFWIATLIFLVSFGLIVSEKLDKTKVALIGAGLMIILKVVTQHEAFYDELYAIDYNVIFLLISMMIIVDILKKTGIFQFIAIKSAKLAKGKPFTILVFFACITAFASALLDNVTTVLLIVPVALFIAEELELDPFPFMISEIMACNIGGTATLIGDPPNIMIASKVQLTFMDFIYHLTPAVLFIFAGFILTMKLIFGKKLHVKEEVRLKILAMDEYALIKDKGLLIQSLSVLGLVMLGFVFHGMFHYEPATIALFGAAVLLVISKEDVHHVLRDLEWPTLFFFIGLFIIVGGVVKVGLISKLSEGLITLTEPNAGSMFTLAIVMLWFSAIGSARGKHDSFGEGHGRGRIAGRMGHETPSSTCNPYARLVVFGVRHLPRRKRHPDWRLGKRHHHRACRKGGLPHNLQKIPSLFDTDHLRDVSLVHGLYCF